MKYFILLLSFSFFELLHAQYYYGCNTYYYSSYNNARCCYKIGYYTYSQYYYTYCPYYTATTAPPTTTTSTPSTTSCSYYTYSYYYSNDCCVSLDDSYYSYYYYSYYYYYNYNTYYTYCPSSSTLDSICGSSCCSANVPVYANSDVFYYSTYHCPSTSYTDYYYSSYCGVNCIMAIVFSIFGSCFCICGLAFSIAFCVLVHLMVKKKKSRSQPIKTVQAPLPQSVAPPTAQRGLQDSTMEMKQQFKQETLPPQIPGYTYNSNPANTFDTAPYPPPMNAAMNIPSNPTYLPSPQIVTHGINQQPVHLQPVNAVPTDDGTYTFIQ